MKKFIHDDFLLSNDTARELFHNHAKELPVIDYHCHLPPEDIAVNRLYNDISEAWLGGDHYKWRAMRANGIAERYCSGDADPKEKFMKWADTMPMLIGNPLYHWSHMELSRYFGIDKLLGPDTAEEIWAEVNEKITSLDAGKMGYSTKEVGDLVVSCLS